MRRDVADDLAATINGDYPDWEAGVEPGVAGYVVVATFEAGGVHRLYSPGDWEDVKALVCGED